jgi:hypothetical protein
MKLYYYKDVVGNFGDDLNSWLWDTLFQTFSIKMILLECQESELL